MAESATQSLGRQTELFVESRLMSEGLQPVARNFRCKQGEIDLIMMDGQTLVFVEVRYRRPNRYVSAAQTVNRAKQRKLCNAAAMFLSRHRQFAKYPARFDVVGLDGPNVREFTIQWLKDAFRPRSDRF